jgi:hypothetical protein
MKRTMAIGVALAIGVWTGMACGQSWSNAGGNAGRNGNSDERGPDAASIIWGAASTSVIAWQPVIEGDRVFVVRQTGFPPEPASDRSPIVCLDLDSGSELWRVNLPFFTGDWTTWIAGVSGGRVYASRSGNGASVAAKMYCLDAATGSTLWVSDDTTTAGFYDGVVFAPNGDPIVADFRQITRLDHLTGATVWRVSRLCSVSGNCGAALGVGRVFVADAVPGGHRIRAFDLSSGAWLYDSSLMPGFTIQNSPMVGPDGSVYLSRTQNNVAVDFFYAFTDTGAALTQRWAKEAQWTTSTEYAAGPDGSVYFLAPGLILTRLDATTGAVIDQASSPIASDGTGAAPRMAIDRDGRIYMTNGAFANGRVYAYDADCTLLWDDPITNVNIGGPAMGRDGTLVIAGVGSVMRAYRSAQECIADLNDDGMLDFFDVQIYLAAFSAQQPFADFVQDGVFDFFDVQAFLAAFSAGCA